MHRGDHVGREEFIQASVPVSEDHRLTFHVISAVHFLLRRAVHRSSYLYKPKHGPQLIPTAVLTPRGEGQTTPPIE